MDATGAIAMVEKGYFEKVADTYMNRASRGLWGWVKRRELAVVRHELSEVGTSVRLLDIGCGPGIYAKALNQEHPTWKFTGVDRVPQMAAYYREWGFNGVCLDAAAVDSEVAGTFDVILALGVLEFNGELQNIVRFIRCHCQDFARVLVLTPRANVWGWGYSSFHRAYGNEHKMWRRSQIVEVFSASGFRFLKQRNVTFISSLLVFDAGIQE